MGVPGMMCLTKWPNGCTQTHSKPLKPSAGSNSISRMWALALKYGGDVYLRRGEERSDELPARELAIFMAWCPTSLSPINTFLMCAEPSCREFWTWWDKRYCTTPSKLVVYKPMGAERAADRTIAQSGSFVPFSAMHDVTITLRCVLVWICAILSRKNCFVNEIRVMHWSRTGYI